MINKMGTNKRLKKIVGTNESLKIWSQINNNYISGK